MLNSFTRFYYVHTEYSGKLIFGTWLIISVRLLLTQCGLYNDGRRAVMFVRVLPTLFKLRILGCLFLSVADFSPRSVRRDKELSVSQLISSWLRLHCHTVNNLINTSLLTPHTANWLPANTRARAHTQQNRYHTHDKPCTGKLDTTVHYYFLNILEYMRHLCCFCLVLCLKNK